MRHPLLGLLMAGIAFSAVLSRSPVSWKNGSLGRFDDEALGKKILIAFDFSAHWSAPCRK
jgi:hypothetical protein